MPEGATAFEVSYTFADGETVPAETVRGPDGSTWWRVVHPLSGRAWVPIDVTVSYSGVQQHYRLGRHRRVRPGQPRLLSGLPYSGA